ncbi:MAG TPA: dTDP-glucose 4,6-dehydratase [Syntrophorhabdaceae bacterium]|nr:dTDP-glucose 4,6-dehydratase [Syntrophorhabdaceae bacterium]
MAEPYILITGGCGFIGSNFVRRMLAQHDYRVVNFDKLTYAGNLENLKDIENDKRYTFFRGDIAQISDVERVFELPIEMVVNFAAESHVDRSILDPETFIKTNINGTFHLLEMARKKGVKKFVQISTDEVYGSLGRQGKFSEETPLAPNSPYSASKTSADVLAMAYHKTYGTPVVVTRCSNNYGPYQFPEKLIPLIISNALHDVELPVYGDGLNIRDWIHVADHCEAIDVVLHKGKEGNVYNVGGENERTNIEIVKLILKILKKPETLIRYVKDRPGHDRRYAIDSTKLQRELGFQPRVDFAQGMEETVMWYRENREWWERIKSGAYMEYYKTMYENR